MPRTTLSACIFVAAATACATPAPPQTSPEPDAIAAPQSLVNRNRDVITKEELAAPGFVTFSVLDVVRAIRPQYLSVRGMHSLPAKNAAGQQIVDEEAGKVHASIDGSKIVPVGELSAIRASTIVEIRYLSPAAAMQRFGGAAREGPVILIKTM